MIVAILREGLELNILKHPVRAHLSVIPFLLTAIVGTPLFGLDRTWIGGNADWIDGGSTANWAPADEPDANDTAIFNTGNAVSLGSNNAIIALTMSGGIDLFTNAFDLDVNGLVQLNDSGTNLIVGGDDSLLTADGVTVNNLANLQLDGGTVRINEESGNGLLDINVGGELLGHGTLNMTDAVGANTTLIINDGFITAQRSPAIIFGAPVVGTLAIDTIDADARIDLDGAGEAGAVIVRRNQTLDVNIQLADIFNGTIDMFQNSTLDMSNSWILGANATLDIDNGFIPGIFPNPSTPAGTSIIAGASFSQNGGTITVVDSDGTLQFDAPFTMNSGNLVANGHVIFNANATIGAGANFTRPTDSSDITVEAGHTLTINQANFDLDGFLTADTVLTINAGATLVANLGDYDPDQVTNSYSSTINLNNGDMNINTGDPQFVMNGVLNMHSSVVGQITSWLGEAFQLGNDSGVLDSDLNVTGTQQTQFAPSVTFKSDADVDVAVGSTLNLLGTVNFDTVNAANNAEFTGAGRIAFSGQVNVNEAATLNMVGGEVDLDGLDAAGDFVNIDAPLTINAKSMSNFGKVNGGGGINTLDINNNAGTGVLTVNLDNAADEWTLNAQGVMNLVNDNTEATLLAGNDVNINGTVNVTGDVRTTARLDITGVVNINTAGQPLRLAGGNAGPDFNTINGATINGIGQIGADTGKALQGFGTINADIAFVGSASLRATGGTLTIGGDIVDVNIIGTADETGTLNVVNAWESDGGAGGSIGAVVLNGGVLQGGQITNDNGNGIQGHGTITSRVINTSKIVATNGGTLVLQTAGNDNDWDGVGNTGRLEALSADLEIRDVGAAFGFGGTVRAINDNEVFANGFALDFNAGSTLELEDTAIYRSTNSTDIGGTVNIASGADATIQVQTNTFLTFENGSTTTLAGDLTLVNNNIIIKQGAVFSNSGGALIVPEGSHVVGENLANIGVLLDMQGGFRPGNSNGIGRVDLFDYQQSSTGQLYLELTGTSLNAFDRLVASGDAVIDGYLEIDIDDVSPGVPFVPVLGQTFNIITANSVIGEFDYANVFGMPEGLTFHIEYLSNAVQLQVVATPFFSADFDEDGDVDPRDLEIWQGAYNLNQLGDADGDNDSDGRDFLIWQRQFGSAPLQAFTANVTVPEPGSVLLLLMFMGISLAGKGQRTSQRK